MRAAAAAAAGLVLASTAVSGCSSGPSEEPASAESSSAEASPTPTVSAPEGVSLTDEGSELELGDTAEVVWQPRSEVTGAIDIRVDSIEQVSIDEFSAFRISRAVRRSTPYFVRARIENVGPTRLGNVGVPLYLLDDGDTLIERSTFGSSFDACPSEPLPRGFGNGDRTETCLVFLVPEGREAAAVSFRPTEEYVPITWTGEIETPRQGRQGRQDRQGGQGSQGRN